MSNKNWKTASELMEELANDPEYQARRAKMDVERKARRELLDQDQRSLVAELAEAGICVSSVWDLVNTREPYPNAIPVLIRHLGVNHHKPTREGITRALICKESQGIATRTLIDLFKSLDETENDYKWILAQAISASATKDTVPEILELARDKRHGSARGELLYALRLLDPNIISMTLVEFLDDADANEVAHKMLATLQGRRTRRR
jgi:hypothetical protein